MEPAALRTLIRKHGHSAASAADTIGANVNQFRDWTNGRRPVPAWARAKLAQLTDRSPDTPRWSPAAIDKSTTAKVETAPSGIVTNGAAAPATTSRPRRKSRSQRLRERLANGSAALPEIDPLAYDKKHPVREAEEPAAPSGF